MLDKHILLVLYLRHPNEGYRPKREMIRVSHHTLQGNRKSLDNKTNKEKQDDSQRLHNQYKL